jgi:hypothetical protein
MNRWRVGEDRGSKETDGCPLTLRLTRASIVKGPRRWWDSFADGLLVAMSLPSSQTVSPGAKIGVGSHRQL